MHLRIRPEVVSCSDSFSTVCDLCHLLNQNYDIAIARIGQLSQTDDDKIGSQ